jgi:hypothetical protein
MSQIFYTRDCGFCRNIFGKLKVHPAAAGKDFSGVDAGGITC